MLDLSAQGGLPSFPEPCFPWSSQQGLKELSLLLDMSKQLQTWQYGVSSFCLLYP